MLRRTTLATLALTAAAFAAPAPTWANHGPVSGAVVGYVQITYITALGQTAPSFTAYGVLATPAWSCTDNLTSGYPAAPYAVTCVPTGPVDLSYHCDVLHADIHGLSLTAKARTSLDCDGVAGPEAQTAYIGGTVYDFDWAASSTSVTKFTCTVDGNQVPAASPDYRAGCGDPGTVRLHQH